MVGHFSRLAVLALLSIGTYAEVNDDQQPIIEYNKSPITAARLAASHAASGRLPSSFLKPTSFEASAQMKTNTTAELAIVQIRVEKEAASEKAALTLARDRRDEIENLIQSLSQNTTSIHDRFEYSDFNHRRYRTSKRFRQVETESEDDAEPVSANAELIGKFTDMNALARIIASLGEATEEDVYVESVQWRLTPETKEQVKRSLRRDSIEELRKVGREYEDAFDVVLTSMEDYTENASDCDRFFGIDDGEEQSNLYSWSEIRKFFIEADEEPKVGQVSTRLNVKCKFIAGGL